MIRTEGGHFWLDFENGYTLSVFNGFGSHTENNFALDKWKKIVDDRNIFLNSWESKLVEIAIIYNGDLVTQNRNNINNNNNSNNYIICKWL